MPEHRNTKPGTASTDIVASNSSSVTPTTCSMKCSKTISNTVLRPSGVDDVCADSVGSFSEVHETALQTQASATVTWTSRSIGTMSTCVFLFYKSDCTWINFSGMTTTNPLSRSGHVASDPPLPACWWQSGDNGGKRAIWSTLYMQLLSLFSRAEFESLIGQLYSIGQVGLVIEFVEEFVSLIAQIAVYDASSYTTGVVDWLDKFGSMKWQEEGYLLSVSQSQSDWTTNSMKGYQEDYSALDLLIKFSVSLNCMPHFTWITHSATEHYPFQECLESAPIVQNPDSVQALCQVQCYVITSSLKVLPLSYDMVVDRGWLIQFKPRKIDWDNKWLVISYSGSPVMLHGIGRIVKGTASALSYWIWKPPWQLLNFYQLGCNSLLCNHWKFCVEKMIMLWDPGGIRLLCKHVMICGSVKQSTSGYNLDMKSVQAVVGRPVSFEYDESLLEANTTVQDKFTGVMPLVLQRSCIFRDGDWNQEAWKSYRAVLFVEDDGLDWDVLAHAISPEIEGTIIVHCGLMVSSRVLIAAAILLSLRYQQRLWDSDRLLKFLNGIRVMIGYLLSLSREQPAHSLVGARPCSASRLFSIQVVATLRWKLWNHASTSITGTQAQMHIFQMIRTVWISSDLRSFFKGISLWYFCGFLWDPGGENNNSGLGASRISRRRECQAQAARWPKSPSLVPAYIKIHEATERGIQSIIITNTITVLCIRFQQGVANSVQRALEQVQRGLWRLLLRRPRCGDNRRSQPWLV